jgi:hypothetical protein
MRLIELFENHSFFPLQERRNFITQDEINAVKAKWDEGKKPSEISSDLGINCRRVNLILNQFYQDRPGKKSATDADTIELVKLDWDAGKKPMEIADNLGLDVSVVATILKTYYPNRPGKVVSYTGALTDDDKAEIVAAFRNGDGPSKIADRYGLSELAIHDIIVSRIGEEEYKQEMAARRSMPGVHVPSKVTPEMLEKIIDLYRQGNGPTQIADKLNNVVTRTTVDKHLKDLPNWEEIRAEHDKFAKRKGRGPTTKKKTRAGEIGNLQSKGRGSKHFDGQYPSKQYSRINQ